MEAIDLTHTIRPDMPMFPGDRPPALTSIAQVEQEGYAETSLSFCSHTGTHMDAPAHVFARQSTLDHLPVSRFIGRGCLIDCRGSQTIGPELLRPCDEVCTAVEFVLFYTGWGEKWGTPAYYEGYPCLTPSMVAALADRNIRGIGLDTISPDSLERVTLPRHKELLQADILIVENLARLWAIGEAPFLFCAFPLKYISADGAPVRAVALRL